MDSIYVDVLLFVRHLLGTRRYRRSQTHSEHQPFLSCGGYLLRHIEIDYIDIGEAADFVAVYVDMLNKRYHGNIILQNEINAETDQGFILTLSLQLLIENAVKHNYPQEDQKLYIRIYVRDKMLVVRNNRIYNGCRNDQNVESYGIGIRNLCRRYELECGTQPEFQATTDAFEARLPVLPKKQDI